jgi:hypothetical protein
MLGIILIVSRAQRDAEIHASSRDLFLDDMQDSLQEILHDTTCAVVHFGTGILILCFVV